MTAHSIAGRLRFLRPVLYAVLVLDVVALGAFAVRVQTVTRTESSPATAQATAPLVPAAPTAPAAPLPVPPVVAIGTTTATGGVVAEPALDSPAPTKAPDRGAPTPTPGVAPTNQPSPAKCPIGLKEPASSGGLQTLISYAPAFGPFRDEAFAAAAAYQPVLQLLGPILSQYPKVAGQIEPALAPFLGAFASLLDQGYSLVAPLYAPHRAEVLEAEGKLAAALAPYAQKLATSELGGCVVDLQAALLQDTAG